MHRQFFQEAERLLDKYVSMWVDVCNLESYTSDKAGVDAVGDYFAAHARSRGYGVDICRQEVSGNALTLIMNAGADGAPICLSGHMDTVFPRGLFGEVPTHVEGDKIYGPGVTDCKGGLVAACLAMEALSNCGYAARPIKLILQSDEELSSMPSDKSTVAYMAKMAEGSRAFLNLEGSREGYHTLVRKGIVRYNVDVYGVAAHSSQCEKGRNAIVEASHKILALEGWKRPQGVTVNVGIIEGGNAANTVAEHCRFVVDIRYPDPDCLPEIEAIMQQVCEHAYVDGTRATLSVRSRRVSMPRTEKNEALLSDLNRAYAAAGLSEVLGGASTGGSDAADMTAYGIATVDNLGARGGRIHSTEEFAYVDSLLESAKRMIAAILYLD